MATLKAEIEQLQPAHAIEAAQFLCAAIVPADADETAAHRAVDAIFKDPYKHMRDVEELARLVLISAAEFPEFQPEVRKAIDGVGQKQAVLGGAEIVALSVVGVLALQVILTKGKSAEESEEIIETDPATGKKVVIVKKKVKYGVGQAIASVLLGFFGK